MAHDSATKAEEAYKDAEEFAKVAEQSSEEMGHLTEAMERINSTSREIETIIAEIEDIATGTAYYSSHLYGSEGCIFANAGKLHFVQNVIMAHIKPPPQT